MRSTAALFWMLFVLIGAVVVIGLIIEIRTTNNRPDQITLKSPTTILEKTKDGVYLIQVTLDREIPYDLGLIFFGDGKLLEFRGGNARIWYRDKGWRVNQIIIYLDPERAPLGIKEPNDLITRLPLKVRFSLKHYKKW